TVQAEVTVQVTTPPKVNLLTAEPSCVVSGGSTVLRWNVSDAAAVTINGTPVDPASGSMTVMPTADTTYTLVATGGGCAPQQRQAQVTVTVDDPPPLTCPAVGFTATPDCIVSGQSSQLQWSVTDADSVTIDGTPVALSGSLSVTPSATTLYTLVASRGACAPQQSQVTVEVARPPTINLFKAAPNSVQQGQSA